jgi:hypothetical protein
VGEGAEGVGDGGGLGRVEMIEMKSHNLKSIFGGDGGWG